MRLCAARTDHQAAGSSLGTLRTHVRERDGGAVGPAGAARDALDGGLRVELDDLKLPVDVTAIMETRDRLLSGIAALLEADVRRVETGLRRQDRVVELAAPARNARLDAAELELVVVHRRLEARVEHFDGAGKVRGDAVTSEDEERRVLLHLDLALRAQAHANELRADRLAELGLGQEEEVLLAAAPDDERRDQPRLRRQEQCRARVADAERVHVVRDHALEIVARVRSGDPDEGTRTCSYIHPD